MRLTTLLLALPMSALLLLSGCSAAHTEPDADAASPLATVADAVVAASFHETPGQAVDRDFVVDNVLHSAALDDIHYNLYVPESYDGSKPVALFITLSAEPGLYPAGPGANLRVEEFAFNAQAYDPDMIVAAPQCSDWTQNSADQVIALTEFLLRTYEIDPERVYIEGYSYGGETLSYVMGTRPELYRAALHCASQWNGDLQALAAAQVPVRFVLGDSDAYYSVENAQRVVAALQQLYREAGLSDEEIGRLVSLDVKSAPYFDVWWYEDQHGTGSALMARDPEVLGWLFRQ